ncbi:hypothetical protein YC2023_059891 [Brassica napus]
MDLKDSSHANVKCEEELHDTSAASSEKMPLEPDPRWPYLKKWSVTASPSPQLPRSVTVQDHKNAWEGAWTIPLKMASFNSMGTDKKGKGHLNQASQTTPNGLVCLRRGIESFQHLLALLFL